MMGQLHPGAPSGRAELLATLKAKALAGAPAPSAGRLAIVEELKMKYLGSTAPGEAQATLPRRAELLATLRAKVWAGAPAPSAGRVAIVEELKTKYCQALAQGALPQPSTTGGASPRPAPEDAVSRMEVETSAGGTKRQG